MIGSLIDAFKTNIQMGLTKAWIAIIHVLIPGIFGHFIESVSLLYRKFSETLNVHLRISSLCVQEVPASYEI